MKMNLKIATIAVAVVLGFCPVVPTHAEESMPVKVIIDADPGVDDAMVILFALRSPAVEVVGITTVFGNTAIDNATANALTLVGLVGASVPVARGAEHPLVKDLREPPKKSGDRLLIPVDASDGNAGSWMSSLL